MHDSTAREENETAIVLFLDYNFGGKIVSRALTVANIAHEIHITHFEMNAPDVEWLPEVGRRGWIVITKDKKISRNLLEVEALRNAGVGAFILSSDNLTGAEIAAALVAAFPRIESFVRANEKPFIAKFYKDGRVIEWKNFEEETSENKLD